MRRHRPQRARPIDVPAGPAVETLIEAVGGEGDGIAAGPLYAPFTLPGERVRLAPGPQRREVEAILDGGAKRGAIPPLWDGHAAERIAAVFASGSV